MIKRVVSIVAAAAALAALTIGSVPSAPAQPAGGAGQAQGASAHPPGAGHATALSARRRALVAAAGLGLTPEVLAACGFTPGEAALVLQRAGEDGALSALWSSAGPPPGHAEAHRPGKQDRERVLGPGLGADRSRLAKLERCIAGVSAGLPADIAVGCNSLSERSAASAALVAERRAVRMGRELAAAHALLLATLRARDDVVAAKAASVTHLEPIQSGFRP